MTETARTIHGAAVTTMHVLSLNSTGRELTLDQTLIAQHGYRSQVPRNTGSGKEVYIRVKPPRPRKNGLHPSGNLPDGRTLKGPEYLKVILGGDHDAFTRALAEKLLVYAVGRGVERYDHTVIKQIAKHVSNVKLETLAATQSATLPRPRYGSKISIYDLASKTIRTLYQTNELFEAPNWSLDGKYLLSNSRGRLYRIPVDRAGSPTPEPINLDTSVNLDKRKYTYHRSEAAISLRTSQYASV